MAYSFSLPFHAFRLRFPAKEDTVLKPLVDSDVVRIGHSFHVLAEQFQKLLQKKVLDKGYAANLMDLARYGDYQKGAIPVEFPAAADGFSFPAFVLDIDYFYTSENGKWWGIAPVSGVEASADSLEMLHKNLSDNIKIYFSRTKRLSAVQGIVSALWFEYVELLQKEIALQSLTPSEVEIVQQEKQKRILAEAGTPLTALRPELFGMEAELDQILRAMRGSFGRSLLLVGPNGAGKSALVAEAVRLWKAAGNPEQVWETTASLLIKELSRETGWQYNLALLCRELTQSGDWLYVRNLMELFEVGRYAGNDVSMGEFLRTYLSRAEIALISECTPEELQFIEALSPDFSSCFSVVKVNPPGEEALETIVGKKIGLIADERKRKMTPEAIREAIRLHRRFNPYSGMPGKVIRFLEALIKQPLPEEGGDSGPMITQRLVIRFFCEESGIPPLLIDESELLDPVLVEQHFNSNVFGQQDAVTRMVSILVKEKVRLSNFRKPIASLLFAGPTGVGKTELAKVTAEFMFGDRNRMNRFDMSEYSGYDAIMRLTGPDGLLTSAVRREPFSVLLFDEIEKANPVFHNLLLQILEDGRLTDSRGRLVNFCSTVIIMTSNIGAGALKRRRIGMTAGSPHDDLAEHYKRAVEKAFPPELVNRFEDIIPFRSLDAASIRQVVDREMALLTRREGIRYRRFSLHVDPSVLEYFGVQGFDAQYGARYLQRVMRERLVLPLAKALSQEDPDDELDVHVVLDPQTREPVVQVQANPLSLELLIEELQEANLANTISGWRRHAAAVAGGFLFREALSDWSLLEDQRRLRGERFWKNQESVRVYHHLQQLIATQKAASSDIAVLETDAALAFLGEKPADASLAGRTGEWFEAYSLFKRELVAFKSPHYNRCVFSVYGQELHPVLNSYLSLFDAHHIKYAATGVWLRDAYYNEEIWLPPESPNGTPVRRKREKYIYEPVIEPLTPLKYRPKTGDQLVGVIFKISAPLVYLMLLGEGGFQHWILPDNTEHKYFVSASLVEEQAVQAPADVHRKLFFKPAPRRTVSTAMQRDAAYEIIHEGGTSGFFELISEKWKKNLDKAVNEAVLE